MKQSYQDQITLHTAFVVMQRFLESYWQRTGQPEEIGSLLGDISLLPDGTTADPAAIEDWLKIAHAVTSNQLEALHLTLERQGNADA